MHQYAGRVGLVEGVAADVRAVDQENALAALAGKPFGQDARGEPGVDNQVVVGLAAR